VFSGDPRFGLLTATRTELRSFDWGALEARPAFLPGFRHRRRSFLRLPTSVLEPFWVLAKPAVRGRSCANWCGAILGIRLQALP
jgi:hypothetical protein